MSKVFYIVWVALAATPVWAQVTPPANLRCERAEECVALSGVCGAWVLSNRISVQETLEKIEETKTMAGRCADIPASPYPTVACKQQRCVEER